MAKELRDDEALDESITLEGIRKELEKNAKNSGNFLSSEEIVDAVAPLDLSDKELENLVTYFKNKKIEVVVENADVEEDIDDIEKNIDEVEEDIDDIEKNIDDVEENIDDIEKNIDEVEEDVEDNKNRIDDLFAEIELLKKNDTEMSKKLLVARIIAIASAGTSAVGLLLSVLIALGIV